MESDSWESNMQPVQHPVPPSQAALALWLLSNVQDCSLHTSLTPPVLSLSMKQHIARITSNCFYHLRRLRQIRCVVGKEVTSQLVSVFILSRLDYCNSLLAGLPSTTVKPLQRVQNAAVRLVLNLGLRDHATPGLQ